MTKSNNYGSNSINNRNPCREVALLRLHISIHTRIQQPPQATQLLIDKPVATAPSHPKQQKNSQLLKPNIFPNFSLSEAAQMLNICSSNNNITAGKIFFQYMPVSSNNNIHIKAFVVSSRYTLTTSRSP